MPMSTVSGRGLRGPGRLGREKGWAPRREDGTQREEKAQIHEGRVGKESLVCQVCVFSGGISFRGALSNVVASSPMWHSKLKVKLSIITIMEKSVP